MTKHFLYAPGYVGTTLWKIILGNCDWSNQASRLVEISQLIGRINPADWPKYIFSSSFKPSLLLSQDKSFSNTFQGLLDTHNQNDYINKKFHLAWIWIEVGNTLFELLANIRKLLMIAHSMYSIQNKRISR